MALAAGSSSGSTAAGSTGFRVILGDAKGISGQRIKRFEERPLSTEQLAQLVRQNFDLSEYHGGTEVAAATAHLADLFLLVGHDGPRRVRIRNDEELHSFFSTPFQHTSLPSIEVQLALGAQRERERTDAIMQQRRADAFEQVQLENATMKSKWDTTLDRVGDLERVQRKDQEDLKKLVNAVNTQVTRHTDDSVKALQERLFALQEVVESDTGIKGELQERKRGVDHVIRQIAEIKETTESKLSAMEAMLSNTLGDMDRQLKGMRDQDERLKEEDLNLRQELVSHARKIQILESLKVSQQDFQEKVRSMDDNTDTIYKELTDKIQKATERMDKGLQEMEKDFATNIEKTTQKLQEANEVMNASLNEKIASLSEKADQHSKRMDEMDQRTGARFDRLEQELKQDLKDLREQFLAESTRQTNRTDKLEEDLRQDATAKYDFVNKEIAALTKEMGEQLEQRDDAVHKRLEDAIGSVDVRVVDVEKNFVDLTAQLRSELETCANTTQTDLKNFAERLDEQVTSAHKKMDRAKEELGVAQDRVTELKGTTMRQLADTQMQMQAVQMQSMEGIQASSQMIGVIKDDQFSFREKIAKHIRTLQLDNGNQSEAIAVLEQQKKRLRIEFDAMAEDYKDYVTDMDTFNSEIKAKVDRLFKSLEPTKVEWKIARVKQRTKELVRPMSLRSPPFELAGIKELRFDWYPAGWQGSPDGMCMLRVYAPTGTKVASELYFGALSDGVKEWESGEVGGELWKDFFFDRWEREVIEDKLVITLEIVTNYRDEGEINTGKCRIESL